MAMDAVDVMRRIHDSHLRLLLEVWEEYLLVDALRDLYLIP
jgi:hypothetical protein